MCGIARNSTSRSISASRTSRNLEILQIAQAAVKQLGRGRRRCRTQIVHLCQRDAKAPPRRVARDAAAVDAAADDEDIKYLGGRLRSS